MNIIIMISYMKISNIKFYFSVCNELLKTGKFQKMAKSVDEDEHSIEMQLPYIAKVFEK